MYLTFESVIEYYHDNDKYLNQSNFSNRNLDPIKKWLKHQLKLNDGKDNSRSTLIRKQGNIFYKEKSLKKSLKSYNSSICYAHESSEEYYLALANRSAATFELEEYEDCLKDIESCLGSSIYPKKLRPKLHSRKVECLKKLGSYLERQKLLEKNQISLGGVSAAIFEKLSVNDQPENKAIKNVDSYKLLSFEEGENFAYASSRIEMRYNEKKGRHVVAKQTIKKGDILFLEKAFAFGSIFDEYSRTINMLKCYHCLNNIYCGIPCCYCAKCIFCNSKCREKSWEESHRWECRGMFGDIWYHLGIAFPAFRALLKGIDCSFKEVEVNNIKCFGDKKDNYPFFNSLLFEENNKYSDVSIMSVTVITYLLEYTNFFDWFLSQPKNANWSMEHLVIFFERQLGKHILQFQNNSSIIEHWLEEDETLPLDKEPVACGIFPSVSIMNHSCKPNISNYFVCDTIVVKALVDINKDEEICNCYGIYYRDMKKIERQQNCSQLYHFECNCVICSDPSKEMDVFDVFICLKCGCDIPEIIDAISTVICKNCGSEMDYRTLMDMYQGIELDENENDLQSLLTSSSRKKKLLNKYHSGLQKTHFQLYLFYKQIGNIKCMLEYFEKWLKVEKMKVGQDVQLFGAVLYEVGSFVLSKLGSIQDKQLFSKAKEFMMEAIRICELHYPADIINRIQVGGNSMLN